MKAIWNDTVIAESNDTKLIEGNHSFPPNSIKKDYFKPSETHTTCPWKGVASYYTIHVDGKQNEDAAWYYPEVKDQAKAIKDHVAFWRGVTITE